MRHLRIAKLLLAFAITGAAVSPTLALPGPDPASVPEEFTISFEEVTSPLTFYDRLTFRRADGWDFGDRDGYECADIERFLSSGEDALILEFEQSKDYLTASDGAVFRINDRGGAETGDGNNIPAEDCGNEVSGPPGNSRWTPSGEDHFPHILEGNDPATHGVRIYVDGVIDQVATDTLNSQLFNALCDPAYWSPGDEPRELVLWWDEDLPENAHHDGTAPLDCGAGGNEPVAVARAYFSFLAPNVGVCILDHDAPGGAQCADMTTPPSPSPPPCDVNPKTGTCRPPK